MQNLVIILTIRFIEKEEKHINTNKNYLKKEQKGAKKKVKTWHNL